MYTHHRMKHSIFAYFFWKSEAHVYPHKKQAYCSVQSCVVSSNVVSSQVNVGVSTM